MAFNPPVSLFPPGRYAGRFARATTGPVVSQTSCTHEDLRPRDKNSQIGRITRWNAAERALRADRTECVDSAGPHPRPPCSSFERSEKHTRYRARNWPVSYAAWNAGKADSAGVRLTRGRRRGRRRGEREKRKKARKFGRSGSYDVDRVYASTRVTRRSAAHNNAPASS